MPFLGVRLGIPTISGGGKGAPPASQLGAAFAAVATFIGNIRQMNNVGAALSAPVTFAADILSTATKQVGAAFSATAAFAGSIVQTNRVGAAFSAPITFAADVAQGSATGQSLAMDMGNFSNTYILQL